MNKESEKLKVLCICAKGQYRSRYLAGYLRKMGYLTKYGGNDSKRKIKKEATKKDIDWADIIIIVRKRLVPIFRKRFNKTSKKIIVLNVITTEKSIPWWIAWLRKIDRPLFHRIWTYPKLRAAIKPYLPLKK